MGNAVKSKLKMLYIMKMLYEKTDESNRMSTAQIISFLERNGISAERRSIYDDIETLRQFGMDILYSKEPPAGYFLASRSFEIPELKLLVDAVQASRFITKAKSAQLIAKLEKLASASDAKRLNRHVYVMDRVKTPNEDIYYNVDMIHEAMLSDREICFTYYRWNADKELMPRNSGKPFNVSPWALTWDDENYYLVAFDSRAGKVKHYRVDKMRHMSISEDSREGRESFSEFDLPGFSRKTFGMFGGRTEKVTILCREKLVGAVIDRFGTDAVIVNLQNGWFQMQQEVTISEQFFGWVFGLGEDVKLAGPGSVVKEFQEMIESIRNLYPQGQRREKELYL